MDYTKQIFKMLGIEPEEEFKLKFVGDDLSHLVKTKYKLDKNLQMFWFYDDDNGEWRRDLDAMFLAILNGTVQIVKIFHPTAEEQLAIDYARACGYKWLAKDKNKTVTAFKEKPKKGTKEWLNTTNDLYGWIELYLPISFIHWEDKEPFYTGD